MAAADTGEAPRRGMDKSQRLRSDPVYRLNSELVALRTSANIDRGNSPDDIALLPSVLHKTQRGFRWLCVHQSHWNWREDPKFLSDTRAALSAMFQPESEGRLKELTDWLEERWYESQPPENNDGKVFGELLANCREIVKEHEDDLSKFDTDLVLHRTVLELAGGVVQEGDKFLDGLVLRKICKNQAVKYIVHNFIQKDWAKSAARPSEFTCFYFR